MKMRLLMALAGLVCAAQRAYASGPSAESLMNVVDSMPKLAVTMLSFSEGHAVPAVTW